MLNVWITILSLNARKLKTVQNMCCYCVPCTTVCCVLCTVYCVRTVPCMVYCVLCTVFVQVRVRYTVNCVLCTVYCVCNLFWTILKTVFVLLCDERKLDQLWICSAVKRWNCHTLSRTHSEADQTRRIWFQGVSHGKSVVNL